MKTTSILATSIILLTLISCGKAAKKQMTIVPESSAAFQKADEGLRCDVMNEHEKKEIYLKLQTINQITTASFFEFDANGNPTTESAKFDGLRLTRLVGTASPHTVIVSGTLIQETALSVYDDKALLLKEVPVTLSFNARTNMQGDLTKPSEKKGKKNKVLEVDKLATITNCESLDQESL